MTHLVVVFLEEKGAIILTRVCSNMIVRCWGTCLHDASLMHCLLN